MRRILPKLSTALQALSTLTMRGTQQAQAMRPRSSNRSGMPSRKLRLWLQFFGLATTWSTFRTSSWRSLAAEGPGKQQEVRRQHKELPWPVGQEQIPASWIRGSNREPSWNPFMPKRAPRSRAAKTMLNLQATKMTKSFPASEFCH